MCRETDRSGVDGTITNPVEWNTGMNTILDIGSLTRTEKLRAMEELWRDLSRGDDEFTSPEWHEDVLREREAAVNSGADEFVPWEHAKKMLRKGMQ